MLVREHDAVRGTLGRKYQLEDYLRATRAAQGALVAALALLRGWAPAQGDVSTLYVLPGGTPYVHLPGERRPKMDHLLRALLHDRLAGVDPWLSWGRPRECAQAARSELGPVPRGDLF